MADELISRQAALEMAFADGEFKGLVSFWDLQILPTVDAVEVVRCRDCMYWQSGENEAEKWEYCIIHDINAGPHGFCHLGDRREEKC